jgi:GntR family transcriptional regulator/MocR family aminotransferase
MYSASVNEPAAQRDGRGHLALRQALAEYLGASRGVNCSPDQIVIVTGVQQALDILARVLLNPGDEVWMEDLATSAQ